MIKGVTKAGLGNVGTIEQYIASASRYGFGAVDCSGKELEDWIAQEGLEHASSYLQEHQVRIGTIGLSAEWRQSEDKFREGLTRLTQDAAAAAALGCQSCTTYILPSTDSNAAHFMALATRRLRVCADILEAYGIRLGLEFVGPHHLRSKWANPFIWDMSSTLDWIDTINKGNVGLLFDAYHWYTISGTKEDILKLNASQIVHAHINDAKAVPISEVLDNDRLYPGEGVIPLTDFLQGLQAIGYKGVISQEILMPQPVTAPAEELFAKSQLAFQKVYAAAGLE
ncbi:sugar phosphate isomerase/epimerase family protein [Paenibacillus thalictri]|uniref:Sugar phosphate isomerase/epimerase n=1 Tax=Paenibacillus thalictri TaxID=2527873 RepID=A0A4Q9DJI2_9BACL|nr:sugar phosphate isomerase/epimerase family protein [Paenibacillus thalictri]TBL71540.1 sugar phosphate isomerase/epimerase [Paenibacillus thalictri]